MSEINSDIAVMKEQIKFINDTLIRIEKVQTNFIDTAFKTFSTKEEHEQTKKELKEMKDSKDWITKSAL